MLMGKGVSNSIIIHGSDYDRRADAALFVSENLLNEESKFKVKDILDHPDLILIEPEGNNILIDQIRSMQDELIKKPAFSKRRVAIIFDANRMNEHASNSLLKTLEEPPSYMHIILLCQSHNSLIPTIKSRCASIRLKDLNSSELADMLISDYPIDKKQAEKFAVIADGNISMAKELASGNEVFRIFNESYMMAESLMRGNMYHSLKAIENIISINKEIVKEKFEEKENESLEGLVDKSLIKHIEKKTKEKAKRLETRSVRKNYVLSIRTVYMWIRDMILISSGKHSETITFVDKINILKDHSNGFEARQLVKAADQTAVAMDRIKTNMPPELVMTVMASKIRLCLHGRP